MTITERTQNINNYRYGFNGQEKSEELGSGMLTAKFWQYDAKIGRRWNVDPKPQISISDYAAFANNPILLIDPLGDKVKFSKDKDVRGKEFREARRRFKMMRKHSETFSEMYKYLDDKNETFTYNITKESGGDARDPYTINIGLGFTQNTEANGSESYIHAQMGLIAHETGHKFREQLNLDPKYPEEKSSTLNIFDKDYSRWNAYNVQVQRAHEVSEKGALHIENIVRSELTRSGRFGVLQINQYYRPCLTLEMSFEPKMGMRMTAIMGKDYDLFLNGKLSKEYYNRSINIYEELGVNQR